MAWLISAGLDQRASTPRELGHDMGSTRLFKRGSLAIQAEAVACLMRHLEEDRRQRCCSNRPEIGACVALFRDLADQRLNSGWIGQGPFSLSDYRVFTRRFDRVVDAKTLPVSNTTRRAWQTFAERTVERRIAWELLGLEYAAKIISATSAERLNGTHITLLVDHSGSMRGQRMLLAATAVDVAQAFLAHLGVSVEILGFTTRSWRGGWSRRLWRWSGKRWRPGRLCDLLHIVYLTPDRRRAPITGLQSLVHMLDTNLLKENVDGEALLWAASRQDSYGCPRNAIVLISDGAPVDDSTLSANGLHYLMDHLREVVTQLGETRVVAQLQIGDDWESVFPLIAKVKTLDDLGDGLFGLLAAILINDPKPEPLIGPWSIS
ncbi:hypothetical protein C3941_04340 [Kaistia algarum]|uniref:cobaltochelatase CobT-related protein n=1 Tax=Kaistia algarum TaxID=2083279 RepID=UPI000CE74F0B|nr:hypothetical protein [Kaistia algarum]MCX5512553.1 hypothetical protein [Kaistia algarum]PPE81920.1 hypothetical protein C3941_04340 [Kaistia algarum]